MSSASEVATLLAAGVAAGLVGSAGGITSLVSFPALLAVGLPALDAAVANNIALVACWPGSALASGEELRGRARWLRRWCAIAAAGGALGAVLLFLTPPGLFSRIAPWLVLGATLVLLVEPRLTAWRERRGARDAPWTLLTVLTVVSVYNGHFGAGAGVMTLTVMLVLVDGSLPTANALKNMLIGAASVSSAVALALSTPVTWSHVAPLAAGMLVGSNLGPRLARRVPAGALRLLIVGLGLALAAELWASAG